jgi:hypothetical protein
MVHLIKNDDLNLYDYIHHNHETLGDDDEL